MRKTQAWLRALVGVVGLTGGIWYWRNAAKAPPGNVEQALKTDLAAYDDQKLLDFVSTLKLDGSTQAQRVALMERLKARFDAMSLTMRLSMILSMRKLSQEHPQSSLMDNGRLLMEAYFNREVSIYMKATPAEKQKMLDARIDESLVYENLQKLQDAAKGIFGGKSGPSDDELRQMQHNILNAAVDSLKNGDPAERAAMAQYLQDLTQRRTERGLPTRF